MNYLSVEKLSKAFGEKILFKDISFGLDAGEKKALIARNGAGKSTLARLVVGLWAPTAGGIYLDGQSTYTHERGSFGESTSAVGSAKYGASRWLASTMRSSRSRPGSNRQVAHAGSPWILARQGRMRGQPPINFSNRSN